MEVVTTMSLGKQHGVTSVKAYRSVSIQERRVVSQGTWISCFSDIGRSNLKLL